MAPHIILLPSLSGGYFRHFHINRGQNEESEIATIFEMHYQKLVILFQQKSTNHQGVKMNKKTKTRDAKFSIVN